MSNLIHLDNLGEYDHGDQCNILVTATPSPPNESVKDRTHSRLPVVALANQAENRLIHALHSGLTTFDLDRSREEVNRESRVVGKVAHERDCSTIGNVDGTIAAEVDCIDNEQITSSDKYQAALIKPTKLSHLRKLVLTGLLKPIGDLEYADYTNEVIPKATQVVNSTPLFLFSRLVCTTIVNKPKF